MGATGTEHARGSTEILRQIREKSHEYESLADRQLVERTEWLRDSVKDGQAPDSVPSVVLAFSLLNEAARRTLGISFYDVQFLAGLALTRGSVAEMQTGEGKTFVAALPAFVHALTGKGVHVITTNIYLARRDFEVLVPLFEILGVSVGLLDEDDDQQQKLAAYGCDITYGPGYEFGFDYLRDQVALLSQKKPPLGQTFRKRLQGKHTASVQTVQRGLSFAIIDEVDSVLIDDASSPLVLGEQVGHLAEDADAHVTARNLILELSCPEDYVVDASTGLTSLTEQGSKRIHANAQSIPLKVLQRPWSEYIQQALKAEFVFREGIHYVVQDAKVRIVDQYTGRIFSERSWRDGLHQAIEAKEGLEISAQNHPLATITRQRFFRLYDSVCGMTGTAMASEHEFWEFYRLRVVPIPLRKPSQRLVLQSRYFSSAQSKWVAVADDLERLLQTGRPVLVGTRTIANSETLAALLDERGLPYQLLNGIQDEEEASIVARAGQPATITIATNMAGRGTDIKVPESVLELGGLHVLATDRNQSQRIDRQLIGRTARQGEPGTAQFLLSVEDGLVQMHAPWMKDGMQDHVGENDEITIDLTGQFRKTQCRAEKEDYARRRQLFQFDQYRDSVMEKFFGEV